MDCLIKGAAEMFLSPEVAIIQHSAGVMQVTNDYFENGITFFTNLVYSAIRFGVGNGEVAPVSRLHNDIKSYYICSQLMMNSSLWATTPFLDGKQSRV